MGGLMESAEGVLIFSQYKVYHKKTAGARVSGKYFKE
jgi:hypothetical protein